MTTKLRGRSAALTTLTLLALALALGLTLAVTATSANAASTAPTPAELERQLHDGPALAGSPDRPLTEDERIAGLSKLWSEVKYNFIDTDRLRSIDWDRLYLQALPDVRAADSTLGYYRVLMRLMARLEDGHSNVYPPMALWDTQLAPPALRTEAIAGRVMVTQVLDDRLSEQGVVPGSEVLAVDGEPVRSYLAREVWPTVSASTPQDRVARGASFAFLAGPLDRAPLVRFAFPDGRQRQVAVPRLPWSQWAARGARPAFQWRMLPGEVALIRFDSFADDRAAEQFLAAFPELARAKAWVIDLRANGGGNSSVGWRVLATLAERPFHTGRWQAREYRPVERAWGMAPRHHGETASTQPPDEVNRYRRPVAVLIGASTYSAAEDFAMSFDAMKRGVLVGEPTGGSTGQPLTFSLPGGGLARVCVKRDTYPDGRAFVGIGIQPNRLVQPSFDAVRAGRDPVLEAALAAVRGESAPPDAQRP